MKVAKPKAEEKSIVPQEAAPLAEIPADLMQHSGQGTESIGSDDVKPPRLMICQSGSPQRKPDDPKQIVGLNELDMFNDLSQEIYGRGPLKIVVIRCLGSRHIEFAPMEEGGGVKDYDVRPGDPRTLFTTDEGGERVKPVATKFYDYLVWLPEHSEVLVLSMKSTQLKVAMRLNGLLKLPLKIGDRVLPNPPAWARTFELTTAMEKRDNYSWGNYGLRQVGITDDESRAICASLAESYKNKNVQIDRDNPDAEAGDFVPDSEGGGMQ